MTAREKVLAGVLGTVVAAGVVGVGGYVALYKPVADKLRAADAMARETEDKRFRLAVLRKDLARLPAAQARSLPADPVVAKQEYEAALSRLLREARVPRGYTVAPRAVDGRAVLELAPKVPAYQRVAFGVSMKGVDLGTLTDFLERYYALGVLHQITKIDVKRTEAQATAARRPGGSAGDRADLDVDLTTEAIILDGVTDARRTLRPVPLSAGAVLGPLGYHQLSQTPEAARGLAAPPAAPVLAAAGRDYLAVLAKDPFHGPLPRAIPPAPVVDPPPEDISPFIKLTGLARSSDGRGEATIKDVANNYDYHVELVLKDGTLVPKVEKFYYLKDRRKKLDGGTELNISDDNSGTARRFKVVGIESGGRGLVLMAPGGAGAADEKSKDAGGGRGGRTFGNRGGSSKTAVALAPAHPMAAVAGGPTAGLPQDRVYFWPLGQSLKAVRELPVDEGVKAVEGTRAGWGTVPAGAVVSSAVSD